MPDWAKGDKAYEAYFEASTRANFTPEASGSGSSLSISSSVQIYEYSRDTQRAFSSRCVRTAFPRNDFANRGSSCVNRVAPRTGREAG